MFASGIKLSARGSDRRTMKAAGTTESPHQNDPRWLVTEGIMHSFENGRGSSLLVLDELSLHVGRGELVAMVGPSGGGKSTLLNVIAGLLKPSSGQVLLGGQNITNTAGHVAYMMQDDLLLPWRTVLGNVTLGCQINGRPKHESRRRASALMKKFGLDGFEHYYPDALSGGMRQRTAFMRTVLCDKPVLLLDEPFRGIDALVKVRLHEWLLGLWEEFQLTILFVTHDAEEAVFLSDRTYVLSGRPATVRAVVPIDLPRPRRRDVVASPEFTQLKRRVLEPFWQDDTDTEEGPHLVP
jgi:ABC-type nitrate/sulfonate/bicarbonate transport system ATPase subunit